MLFRDRKNVIIEKKPFRILIVICGTEMLNSLHMFTQIQSLVKSPLYIIAIKRGFININDVPINFGICKTILRESGPASYRGACI